MTRHNWHKNIPKQASVCSRCGLHRKQHPSIKRWFQYAKNGTDYGLYEKTVPKCTAYADCDN